MKALGIVQARLYHYRVPFYQALRERLNEKNIEFVLVHGQPSKHEEGRDDSGHLDWAIEIRNRGFRLGGSELLWQPCLRHVSDCDLLVVQQENRLLVNHWLLFRKKFMKQKVAFWGHGRNFQSSNTNGFKERWKCYWLNKPDWWFAYTDLTKNILMREGYPVYQITVVENAIDTEELEAHCQEIGDSEVAALKAKVRIKGNRVCVYCGSLYQHKRIPFLIEAAKKIREKVSDFELVIIGAGPEACLVESAASVHTWLHYVGPKFGRDKALFMKLGQVFLIPGLVGLAILDAFALGLPMFTTDCDLHSPEICYLRNSFNGYMTPNNLNDYVTKVVDILNHPKKLHQMSKNCKADAKKYTIENMAHNFTQGVLKALSSP